MEIKLISYDEKYKEKIYFAGRTCFGLKSLTEKDTPEKMSKFIKNIIKLDHGSVLEHVNYTINVTDVSRSLLAQWTRHRIGWSFNVLSQHYVPHNGFRYKDLETLKDEKLIKEYHNLMETINNFYIKLCDSGLPHYIAREVLPNGAYTNMYVTFNARSIRHFLNLRLTNSNTPEIIALSLKLLKIIYKITPEIVEDYYDEYVKDNKYIYK